MLKTLREKFSSKVVKADPVSIKEKKTPKKFSIAAKNATTIIGG